MRSCKAVSEFVTSGEAIDQAAIALSINEGCCSSSSGSSCSNSGSSNAIPVLPEAVVFAAHALRLLGWVYFNEMERQLHAGLGDDEASDSVMMQQCTVKEPAEATELLIDMLPPEQRQVLDKDAVRCADLLNKDANYVDVLKELQQYWSDALEVCKAQEGLTGAIYGPDVPPFVALNHYIVYWLQQYQELAGDVLCAELALHGLCNNPWCVGVGKSSKARVAVSTCSRCKAAR
jgi:hypothetical protein